MNIEKKSLIVWSSFLFLMFAWGSSFILIKRALQAGFTPPEVASIRMFSAFCVLIIPALVYFKQIPTNKIAYLALSALISMFLPAYLFATAQVHLPSSVASILNALTPAFTFIIGIALFKQPLMKMQAVGLMVGFVGSTLLILVNGKGEISLNAFAFLILLAACFYGTNVNLVKYKLSDVKSIHLSTFTVAIAGGLAIGYLLCSGLIPHIYENAQVHPWGFGAMVLLGVMGTALSQIIFNNMLTLTTSVFASSITYFIPMVAVFWGLLDGEVLVFWHYVGMAFIIGGILILNKYK
jgi:drug/metabolite transporter (DMT)-like permease